MSSERLIIMARAPRLGAVKTRLARAVGDAEALRAYQALIRQLFKNLRLLPGVQVRFSPDDAGPEMEPALNPGWTLHPQGDGDLGARMERATLEAFASGAARVLLIGSDCPEVSTRDVREAWRELERHDLVVGPALDGGYWLIGLRAPQPDLWPGMPWSTPQVFGETLRRARAAGLKFHLLRLLADVDTAAEWNTVQRTLS